MRLPINTLLFFMTLLSTPIMSQNNLDYAVNAGLSAEDQQDYQKQVVSLFLTYASKKELMIVTKYLHQEAALQSQETLKSLLRRELSTHDVRQFRKALNCLSIEIESKLLDFTLFEVIQGLSDRHSKLTKLRITSALLVDSLETEHRQLKQRKSQLYQLIYGKGVDVNQLHKVSQYYHMRLLIAAIGGALERLKKTKVRIEDFYQEHLIIFKDALNTIIQPNNQEACIDEVPCAVTQIRYINDYYHKKTGLLNDAVADACRGLTLAAQFEKAERLRLALDTLIESEMKLNEFSLTHSNSLLLMQSAFICLEQSHRGIISAKPAETLLDRAIMQSHEANEPACMINLLLAKISAAILSEEWGVAEDSQLRCLRLLQRISLQESDVSSFARECLAQIDAYMNSVRNLPLQNGRLMLRKEREAKKDYYIAEHMRIFLPLESAFLQMLK